MDACFIRLFLIVFFLRQLVVLFCQHCRMPWQTASFCAWYVGRRMMATLYGRAGLLLTVARHNVKSFLAQKKNNQKSQV